MPIKGKNAKERMAAVMREFSKGDLHSGKGGKAVKDRKQAIAIGLSMERRRG